MRNFNFHDAQKGAAIGIKVIPRAKKTEIAGLMDDNTIKIRVAAPAVENAANDALIGFLADLFKIKKDSIEIVVGLNSERKLVSLIGVTPAEVDEIVKRVLPHVSEDDVEEEKPKAEPQKAELKKDKEKSDKKGGKRGPKKK
jgi:hypothetical protein